VSGADQALENGNDDEKEEVNDRAEITDVLVSNLCVRGFTLIVWTL